jgi:hypothetical protein
VAVPIGNYTVSPSAPATAPTGGGGGGGGGGDDGGGLSTGAIVGIAVGGAAGLGLILYGGSKMMGGGGGGSYVEPDGRPPSQFNVAEDEDISTIDDLTIGKVGSGNVSGGYGDQRYVFLIKDLPSMRHGFWLLTLFHLFRSVSRRWTMITRKHMAVLATRRLSPRLVAH